MEYDKILPGFHTFRRKCRWFQQGDCFHNGYYGGSCVIKVFDFHSCRRMNNYIKNNENLMKRIQRDYPHKDID